MLHYADQPTVLYLQRLYTHTHTPHHYGYTYIINYITVQNINSVLLFCTAIQITKNKSQTIGLQVQFTSIYAASRFFVTSIYKC